VASNLVVQHFPILSLSNNHNQTLRFANKIQRYQPFIATLLEAAQSQDRAAFAVENMEAKARKADSI